MKPDLAEAYNYRGYAYNAKGGHERAIADYDKAIQLNPDYADAHYNRGNAYAAKGDRDSAISDLEKTLDLTLGKANPKLRQAAREKLSELGAQ
jgi:tetratricopeptide (TPR) repeat protein